MNIMNKKSLKQIQSDKKEKNEVANADIWDVLAAMGSDLDIALKRIDYLESKLGIPKGDDV